MTSPSLAARVVRWQRQHGRHGLPWQGTRDPYRVWLSEVMLQQTQVTTVLDYYGRFLQRFPSVVELAAAPLDDVLALWSGLGYYSRARNLHRCAQTVVDEHAGQFPNSSQALQALPGIGRSTAAAIAAFCFGERVAILDGNVKRVLARALGFEGDLAVARELDRLWELAQGLLPQQGVEAYTQGLMTWVPRSAQHAGPTARAARWPPPAWPRPVASPSAFLSRPASSSAATVKTRSCCCATVSATVRATVSANFGASCWCSDRPLGCGRVCGRCPSTHRWPNWTRCPPTGPARVSGCPPFTTC